MINLNVDENYVFDLKDDFVMNYDWDLYEFIENDPVKAYYLGFHIKDWFEELEKEQQYLYSKQIRHNKEGLENYQKQTKFWIDRYPEEGDVEVIDLYQFLLNNMFYDDDEDIVKLAFFYGQLTYDQYAKQEGSEDIH